jgi:hypothetical protein
MIKAIIFQAPIIMSEASADYADVKYADGVCHNRQIRLASESLEGKRKLNYRASRRPSNGFPY